MRRALVELMTALKYQKVLPLRSDPWGEKEDVNLTKRALRAWEEPSLTGKPSFSPGEFQ